MWRWLLGALVLANLFLMLLWRGHLDGLFPGSREPDRVEHQVRSERLRVVPQGRTGARDERTTPAASGRPRDASGDASGAARPPARQELRAEAPSETRSDAQPETRSEAPAPGARQDVAVIADASRFALPVAPTVRSAVARANEATCVEFAGLEEPRARRARAWLAENAGAASGEVLSEERAYWIVYVPPAPSMGEAQLRMSLLRRQGIEDMFVWQDGPLRYAISIGTFRSEEGAKAAVEHFARQGVRNALVTRRGSADARLLVVRVRYTRSGEADDIAPRVSQLQRELGAEPRPCGTRATVAVARR